MIDKLPLPPIPIPWVVFIALQTGGGFYWAASLENRVESLTREATHISINDNRLTRIEAQMVYIMRAVDSLQTGGCFNSGEAR